MLTLEEIGLIGYLCNLAEAISREEFVIVLSEMEDSLED